MRVYVDADVMAYSVGFAHQQTVYRWAIMDGENEIERGSSESVEAMEALESEVEGRGLRLFRSGADAHPEPVVHALASTKRMIEALDSELRETGLQYDKLRFVLTGSGNFRDKIATIRPYKGNRTAPRPVLFGDIRQYLLDRWPTLLVEGREADDYLASVAAKYEYDPERLCIVSTDKDLKTVPGRLYNPRAKTMDLISEPAARCFFWRQMVIGDSVDNIVGVYKSGVAAANRYIVEAMPETAQEAVVADLLNTSRTKLGCPYADRRVADVLRENGQLLHLQRYEGEIWLPPSERK
jgi:hypothetical protein